MHRRSFLRLGSGLPWGLFGPTWLAGQRCATAAQPALSSPTATSCILLWLDGGPSHLEMWDPKIDAPAEVRGPFASIPTAIPGVHFSEALTRCAARADRMTIVRSMTSPLGEHGLANRYALSGYQPSPSIEHPSLGSIVARRLADSDSDIRDPDHPATGNAVPNQSALGRSDTRPTDPQPNIASSVLPRYIAIPQATAGMGAGFLGLESEPFLLGGDPSQPAFRVRDLNYYPGLDAQRLERRRDLLSLLEHGASRTNSVTNSGPIATPFDAAFALATSASAHNAFDLQQEPEAVRARYGPKTFGQSCLLARRLVERRVPFVTVVQPGWDTHENLALQLRDGYSGAKVGVGLIPTFDQAAAALIDDLEERGLLDSTLVVAMGEFGRTPKLNPRGGRDHWPRVYSVMLCGGGMPRGLVLGASDRVGESPKERPVTPADLVHTLLLRLGIDPHATWMTDDGRPIPINQQGTAIRELL
jgi:hypothetical protein